MVQICISYLQTKNSLTNSSQPFFKTKYRRKRLEPREAEHPAGDGGGHAVEAVIADGAPRPVV